MDDDAAQAIQALEERVRVLEDQLALYRAVSTYGPAVDSVSADVAADLWTEDGVYDVGPTPVGPMESREQVRAMVNGELHGSLVARGCGHMMTMPLVGVDGDRAVGIGYHRLYIADGGFRLWRLAASRWDWIRVGGEWKVSRRTHRLLDGGDEARTLLRNALDDILTMRGGS